MYQSQVCDVRKPSYMHICQHCASCIRFGSEHADLKKHYSRDIKLCMNTLLSEINPLPPPSFILPKTGRNEAASKQLFT